MRQSTLLDGIKERKACLRPRETVVTSTCGRRYVEKKNENGELKIAEFIEPGFGFVVDEKPDLQIARVLPYLFLSSQDVVQNGELLIENGVSHVLSIGVDVPAGVLAPGVVYKKIDLLDLPDANVVDVLDECFQFIANAKMTSESSKILIHCNAGYSRSPTVVIAYLMKEYGYSLEKAIEIVREKRNVRPNVGFMDQLRLFESQLIRERVIQ